MFYLPMIVAVVGAGYLWWDDCHLAWKIIVSTIVTSTLLMQFWEPVQTHHVVPLVIQTLVAVSLLIYFKFQGYTR